VKVATCKEIYTLFCQDGMVNGQLVMGDVDLSLFEVFTCNVESHICKCSKAGILIV